MRIKNLMDVTLSLHGTMSDMLTLGSNADLCSHLVAVNAFLATVKISLHGGASEILR